MRSRRPWVLLGAAVAVAALIAAGTEAHRDGSSSFADVLIPQMPVAPTSSAISSSWFCAGVPATPQRGGDVVVTNPKSVPIRGRLTVYSTSRKVTERDIQVGARDSASFALEKLASGDYLVAFVELFGGGGLVEQRVRHPNGRSLAPCAASPSSDWYLADGLTLGAGYDLVITNPFPDYTKIGRAHV